MKKPLLLLLFISLLISLNSCVFPYLDSSIPSSSSTPTTQTTTQAHFTTDGGKQPINYVWIYSYSEYEDFLANYTDIPFNFVHFEEIKELGTFKGFIRYRDYRSDEFGLEKYAYVISSGSSDWVFECCTCSSPYEYNYDYYRSRLSDESILATKSNDLRRIEIVDTESQYVGRDYEVDDVIYGYMNCELTNILFQFNNMQLRFQIYTLRHFNRPYEPRLSEYDNQTEDILCRLLNRETVAEARLELFKMLRKKYL